LGGRCCRCTGAAEVVLRQTDSPNAGQARTRSNGMPTVDSNVRSIFHTVLCHVDGRNAHGNALRVCLTAMSRCSQSGRAYAGCVMQVRVHDASASEPRKVHSLSDHS
jgi:hypothetical protein